MREGDRQVGSRLEGRAALPSLAQEGGELLDDTAIAPEAWAAGMAALDLEGDIAPIPMTVTHTNLIHHEGVGLPLPETVSSFNAFYRLTASLFFAFASKDRAGPKQLLAMKLLANSSAACTALTKTKPEVDAQDPHVLDHTARDSASHRHIRAWRELEDGKYGRAMRALNATERVDLSNPGGASPVPADCPA